MRIFGVGRPRPAYKNRPLWTRRAETRDGNETLARARQLSKQSEFEHHSDAELIRLAYWGQSALPFN